MIRVKPDWVLAARSLGSLDARMTARWVLGCQGPGFPEKEKSESYTKEESKLGSRTDIMCQVTEVVTNAQKNIAGERTLKMSRVKPDWVLPARSLGSLDARMTAR